jgi:methylenetetrahydrofolate--tRNA-(uracil-5-)-methyltransferase
MHRNTFIESPKFLDKTLRLRPELDCAKDIPPTWFVGQITGSEGYT